MLERDDRAGEDGKGGSDADHENRERDQELDQPEPLLGTSRREPGPQAHVQPEPAHWRQEPGTTVHVVVVVSLPIEPSGMTFVTENDEPPVIDA